MSLIRMPSATAAAGRCGRRRLLPAFHYRLVVLATDKNDRARSRFDGADELGHLVMHGEHVWGLKQVESQAHAFAAAFFMPDRDIREELPSYADWPTVFDLRRPVAGLARRAPPASEEPRPDDRCELPHRRQSPFRARLAAPGADPHPPENPARLLQIVGANGVSKAIPRHIVDAIAGANLP